MLRFLKLLAGVVLGLSAAVAIGLVVLLGTHVGRNFTLQTALGFVNDAIPGRISVDDFYELGLEQLELRNIRVFDAKGKRVLELGSLRVEAALLELRPGSIHLGRVRLQNGWVDLRSIDRPDEGIVSAFVDPNAPAAPVSNEPSPYLLVEAIELDDLALDLPRPSPLAPSKLSKLSMRASFELDQTPSASVHSLTFELGREQHKLLTLSRLQARLARGNAASKVSLALETLGINLSLTAQGVLPPAPRWRSAPVKATLDVVGLDAARLARLARDPTLERAFLGKVDLTLTLAGSLDNLVANLGVESAGGPSKLALSLTEMRVLAFALEVPGFTPGRLLPGAANAQIAARLRGEADFGKHGVAGGFQRVAVDLGIDDAKVDAEPLPRVTAKATLTPRLIEALNVDIDDAQSHLNLAGRVGFDRAADVKLKLRLEPATLVRVAKLAGQAHEVDGTLRADLHLSHSKAGKLTVDGGVSGRRLALDGTSLARLDANLDLAGKPPELAGEVELSLAHLKAGAMRVERATLGVNGGPRHYTTRLDVRSNQGNLKLLAELDKRPNDVVIEASGRATRGGHALDLRVRETHLGAGRVTTEGITMNMSGQTLKVAGQLGEGGATLVVNAEDIDLAQLAELLPTQLSPRGHVSLDARLTKTLERPMLQLLLEGKGVSIGKRPALDLTLEGRFDASEGFSNVNLRVRDQGDATQGKRLALLLQTSSRFSTQGPLGDALADAEHLLELDLSQLDLGFLGALTAPWVPPATGHIAAQLEVSGKALAPKLALNLNGELTPLGTKRPLRVSHLLRLEEPGLEAKLELSDRQGEWLDLVLAATLPPLPEFVETPMQALDQTDLTLDARLAERALQQLPLAGADELPPFSGKAELRVSREPASEPKAELEVALSQTRAVGAEAGCVTKGLGLSSRVSLAGGHLSAELLGRQAKRQLLQASADAELRLTPLLEGASFALGPLSARAKSRKLALDTLPFVCKRFGGKVDLDVAIDDPLGLEPRVEAGLAVINLSAGSRTLVDTHANLTLGPKRADLALKIRHGVNTSRADFSMPIEFSAGHLAVDKQAKLKADVSLVHLPIDPFLDPSGAISYASGSLSGNVKVRGSAGRPRVQGGIDLEEVRFTATDLAQPLRNITGRLEFTEDHLSLKKLAAEDKEGKLGIDGRLNFGNLRRVTGDFRLWARDFPLRQQGQVAATAQVDARVRSTLTPKKTHVRVDLGRTDLWLENATMRKGMALAEHSDVVVDGERPGDLEPTPQARQAPGPQASERPPNGPSTAKHKPASAQAPPPSTSTEIVLDAHEQFWIKRDDFAVKLTALLTTSIEGEKVHVEGKIDLERGYLQLMGKVFEIERGGYLKFMRSDVPDPVLKIHATHDNRRAGNVVSVRISGRGSAPVLDFFVDDTQVTAGDAFATLFGPRSGGSDKDASDQARQFVGGLTAGVLATAARRELGAAAPIIMVEAADDDHAGRVRAGFELDDVVPKFLRSVVTGVYFEGIVANQKESQGQEGNAQGGALLEIYLPNDFYTSGQYGPGTTWSVDVGWQL